MSKTVMTYNNTVMSFGATPKWMAVSSQDTATIGGKTYRTVTLADGNVWMAENLDLVFDGLTVKTSGNPGGYGNYAAYYDFDETTYGWSGTKYGLYYNGIAAKYIDTNRATICPGWHLPSLSEIVALGSALGGTWNEYQSRCDGVGIAMRSTQEWLYSSGSNSSRFNARPVGLYSMTSPASWKGIGSTANFYTSTKVQGSSLYQYLFVLSTSDYPSYLYMNDSMSISQGDSWNNVANIRLIKDN